MATQGHISVLAKEVVEQLDPCRGGIFVDGTVGSGGHSAAMAEHVRSSCSDVDFKLIAIDRDSELLAKTKERLANNGDIEFHQSNFAELKTVLNGRRFDGLLLDLGFSSFQVDDPERGFSFRQLGPLDMRYDQTQELTAAEIVNHWPEAQLKMVIERYSGERYADRIARAITRRRPLYATTQLAELIVQAVPKQGKVHPATRTFQALRIAVNSELESLEQALATIPLLANPGARVAIVAFHSLEDRMVRTAFKKWRKQGNGEFIAKKPITASPAEMRANPRSRSAHLWGFKFN
ncbi:16S rRNA (cytosine(1402)-N(4))-methyltransferase RsmH [Candidatus Berkelbacteria bacterium]|nr:16S rRNA (cytosine(1402)-N(4))-methyltransferase RsmH [Candidatus Berkelbacteria bacterium]